MLILVTFSFISLSIINFTVPTIKPEKQSNILFVIQLVLSTLIMFQFFLLLLFVHSCSGDTYCSNEYQCASSSLDDDYVWCHGLASCIYAQTIVTSIAFISDGSYSSYGATSVISENSFCYGDSSCRNINHFQTKDYHSCHGYRCCFGSTFERISSANSYSDIRFSGDESGAFTTLNLNQSTVVWGFGRLSMYNSIINMYSSSIIHGYGFSSLNGAKLYCEEGQTCEISCYDYGCYNVSSMSGNGNYSIDCRYNLVSNILCNEEEGDDDDIMIGELENIIKSDFKHVDTLSLCTNSSLLGINCGDFHECENDTLLNYENNAICCTSYAGCRYTSASLSVNVSSNTMDKLVDTIGIYCGGSQSCRDGRSGTEIFIVNNVNIDNHNSSASFDIFCDGIYSCWNLDISGADNLLCRGHDACESTTVDSIKNVFGFSWYSIQYATISNITENIYCVASWSCYSATFSEIGGNIYGVSYGSLYNATITNTLGTSITDNIYVIGYQSGYSMEINNVKCIFAAGYQVLIGATISGFRNLYVNGTNALDDSTLTTQLSTNFNDTSININCKVRLYIDGTNSNKYNVTCSNGDECFINCESSTGCTKMWLTCNGTCYVNCGDYGDSTGNDCPSTITGTWYPLTPTSNPTTMPSEYPTELPSIIPTVIPTNVPSGMTLHPSEFPTNVPSSEPTPSSPTDFPTKLPSADSDILTLVIVLISFMFCTIIIIVIICLICWNKRKQMEIIQKQIELDIVMNRAKNLHNHQQIINSKSKAIEMNKFRSLPGSKIIVNLRATSLDAKGENIHDDDVDNCVEGKSNDIDVAIDNDVSEHDNDIEELFIDDNVDEPTKTTEIGIETVVEGEVKCVQSTDD